MKKFISAVLQVLAIALFSILLSSTVFAGGSTSESKNFTMPIAQTGYTPPFGTDTTILDSFSSRDHDAIIVFSNSSPICLWAAINSQIETWLKLNPEIVIDKKDPMMSAYSHQERGSGTGYSTFMQEKCVTTIMVHYHKISPPWVKKKNKK